MTVHRPKIHWRKYFTRKVFFLTGVAIICITVEHFVHMWMLAKFIDKGGEFAFGTLLEHLIFGIPMEEV